MEIITRSDAMARGLNKYFTGKPCPKGHVAQRYVQSSACQACVSHNAAQARDAYAASQDPRRQDRAAFARETVMVRHRVPLAAIASLQSVLAGLLLARFPALAGDERTQLTPDARPIKVVGATGVAYFLCHRDDAVTVEALCNFELARLSEASMAAVHARRDAIANQPADEPSPEPEHLSRNYKGADNA